MTGTELRALLTDWGISRRVFADELAARGYLVQEDSIRTWRERVPRIPEDLVKSWLDNPTNRPRVHERLGYWR